MFSFLIFVLLFAGQETRYCCLPDNILSTCQTENVRLIVVYKWLSPYRSCLNCLKLVTQLFFGIAWPKCHKKSVVYIQWLNDFV